MYSVVENGVSRCTHSGGGVSGCTHSGGGGQWVYSQWWRRMESVGVLTLVVEEDGGQWVYSQW